MASSRSRKRAPEIAGEVISPSLLKAIDPNKPVPKRFNLGMDEYMDENAFLASSDEDDAFVTPAPPKKSKLKKKGEGKENQPVTNKGGSRFQQSFNVTEKEYEDLGKGFVPKATKKNTGWAIKNFQEWRRSRNEEFPANECPETIIDAGPWNKGTLCYWLCRYVVETRRADGLKYPPATLYQLLSGLSRHMRAVDRYAPNIMDSSIPEFKELHSTVDSLFRQLRSEGVGAEVKHAPEITKEEENRLWEKGVLGVSTPLGLLRAVFYCNGKNFCLRGGQEHRRLKISQLSRSSNPDRYVYTENGSKNHSGGFMQLHVENKVVPIYASKDFGDRCHVRLLDLYLSKIPERARKLDVFYLRPLPGVPANPEKPWYAVAPCGENKLASMVKEMFLEIGVENKTNHSLRAAGTTELFRANVPEKIIQQRTGHRSLKALRTYERTTSQQYHEFYPLKVRWITRKQPVRYNLPWNHLSRHALLYLPECLQCLELLITALSMSILDIQTPAYDTTMNRRFQSMWKRP